MADANPRLCRICRAAFAPVSKAPKGKPETFARKRRGQPPQTLVERAKGGLKRPQFVENCRDSGEIAVARKAVIAVFQKGQNDVRAF